MSTCGTDQRHPTSFPQCEHQRNSCQLSPISGGLASIPPGPSARGASSSPGQSLSSLMLSAAKRRRRSVWKYQGICLGGAFARHTVLLYSDQSLRGLRAVPACGVTDPEATRKPTSPAEAQNRHAINAPTLIAARKASLLLRLRKTQRTTGHMPALCKAPRWDFPARTRERFFGAGRTFVVWPSSSADSYFAGLSGHSNSYRL